MAKGPKAPGEGAAERTQAQIGAEQYEIDRQLRPVRTDLYKRISDFKQQRATAENLSATDAAQATQGAVPAAIAARPEQPGAAVQAGIQRAKTLGAVNANTDQRIDQAHVSGLQGLAGMAMGEQGDAIEGMSSLARRGLEDAVSRSRADAARTAAVGDAVGSAVGLAGGLAAAKGGVPATSSGLQPGLTPITNDKLTASFSAPRRLTQPGFGG